MLLFVLMFCLRLAETAGTVTDDDIDDLGLMAVLGSKLLLSISNELLVEVGTYKVDGAATEAAAHDT